ncbi:MAG: alpha/beta hydrolase [Gammaproteobacteria bacterium]|nr:alpha/beta hydrolase [Gammaproteobacteria bacterium]
MFEPTDRSAWERPARVVWAAALLALGGCASNRPMMPTPTVYAAGVEAPFTGLPAARRSAELDILYITDRAPDAEAGPLLYGSGRSPSIAFGNAVVRIGPDASWETLVADATTRTRPAELELTMESVTELSRTPPTPFPFTLVDGKPVTRPEVAEKLESAVEVARQVIRQRLAETPRKHVFMYVHGVQNQFDDAVFATAEMWHYAGREAVPICYTWPAGGGGLLTGYTYDRESSEFTVFHFKSVLRMLANMPEIERIQILAHSRGTDVVVSALRELFIEAWAAGDDPQRRYRIHNLVLAAPDLDIEVLLQRSGSERLPLGVHRVTVYSYAQDEAIGAAMFLFGDRVRAGRLNLEAIAQQQSIAHAVDTVRPANLAVIEYTGSFGGAFGHSYYRANPAVASDVVLTMRYDRDPGAANGRPLEHQGLFFWKITDDYLLSSP